jgi:alkyl sulfatase BDS1-like metallo-beta-lactamase superfamily hydrolase
MRPLPSLAIATLALLATVPGLAQGPPKAASQLNFCGEPEVSSKDAEQATIDFNNAVYNKPDSQLDFSDKKDYDNARRGFIGQPATLTICAGNLPCAGEPSSIIWDLESYKSYIEIDQPGHTGPAVHPLVDSTNRVAPDSVNPSLWRNAQLNMLYGLFRVAGDATAVEGETEEDLMKKDIRGIYQVRAYDLSNITFVKGNTGWIVFDPLISPETAKAALDFINTKMGASRSVSAVIYSHSHVDHYGGAPGLFLNRQPPAGTEFIAPEGFTEHAVSENVIAGNAMARRAIYMYGSLLPRNEKGGVNGGLGQTTSTGQAGLIPPTIIVLQEDETFVDAETGDPIDSASHPYVKSASDSTGIAYEVDGVKMVFQSTPGTEAPAEMNTWLPELKALWMAENATNTLHNILTLRGAQVRDARKWAAYLNETIETWGDLVQVKFQSHHWPLWEDNSGTIKNYLRKQRDIYKFIHDQTVRLMNNGFTGEEISEMIEGILPPELKGTWADRGYYGTLRHNSRAVYQFYMGWYDGHPSDLNNLPPEQVAAKYMEYMKYFKDTADAEEKSVLDLAQDDFNKGQYRWVAEIMKHAVYSGSGTDAEKQRAKDLLADALEQLGYQAESGPWRSVYLQGAYDLRNCVPSTGGTQTATPDTIRAMTPEMVFDFLAVHLCPLADGSPSTAGCMEGATGETLNIQAHITDLSTWYTLTVENAVLNYSVGQQGAPDVTLTMEMDALYDLLIDSDSSGITVASGDAGSFDLFKEMLDLEDDFWFPIVTP